MGERTSKVEFLLPLMFMVRERAQQMNHGIWMQGKGLDSADEGLSWCDLDSYWGL